MARATILLALLALLAVGANVAVGSAHGLGLASLRAHTYLAVPTSMLALLAWTVVVFYFLGAQAWVREQVREERLDPALLEEARGIRRGALPGPLAGAVSLIAAYVVGGGADTGALPPAVHLALALLALLVHLVAVYRTIVFVGMALDLQAKVEAAT